MLHDFLLGKHVEGAVFLHLLQLSQTVNAGAHCLEVGQHAAEPAGVDIVHAHARGLFTDSIRSLLLGADKENVISVFCQLTDELIGFLQLLHGLLKVNDVDAVTLTIDVLGHLGVPASGLVTEVDTGFQQLLHGYDCHKCFSFFVFSSGCFNPSAKPLATWGKSASVRIADI